MTNRADQNWPKGEAYELGMDTSNTVCVGRVHTAVDAHRILAPYAHELNGSGTDCAIDCPACQWVVKSKLEVL
jgi:hypothetical protein